MSGITFTLPFYLQVLRGYDTLSAGMCFLPFAIGQIIAAPRSAKMVARFGYKKVMTTGLVIVGISLVGLTNLALDSKLWVILVTFFFFGFGMGNVIAPASTVMQNVLPLARAGAGSAVQNTVRQVFGALGVAVIATVLATRFATLMKPTLDALPAQFPQAAKDKAAESVGTAVGVFQAAGEKGLPRPLVEAATQGAYDSFLTASHLTSAISAALIFVAALVVFFLLPQITPPTARPTAAPAPHVEGAVHDLTAATREEADAAAAELEESYAREAALEFADPHAVPTPGAVGEPPAGH
jgi:MFS family permease